ncbi:hypothetical protein GobsT_53810 [Gemmata obscuriglobus]|uniref:hypothetical protein n=1 Tax=Gemmata obscuriglobus TaxID=114 RepID=UPI00016C4487|nr:hypothetical protein [Gemmata obscuriglobus]QEG30576.1 hypothetical protein GobsT_53810 [Gemmata obscuriglobus]VTS09900.1 unnamed protein product [Gemmata obscuriglobus UQM 2246]
MGPAGRGAGDTSGALGSEFRERPPHTVAEATGRIKTLTGVRRNDTQARVPLNKVVAGGGVGWVRCRRRRVPGNGAGFFVGAPHFAPGSFLCGV